MGREQNKKGLDEINRNHDEKQNITEKEWALLEKYRNLCEENKLTIDVIRQIKHCLFRHIKIGLL